MKKYLTLIITIYTLLGNAQCPSPTNLVLTIPFPTAAELNWTENGTATQWEIFVIPDFDIGDLIPSSGGIMTPLNPYTLTNLPPSGCIVYFVRSVCSAADVSQWVAVASSGCTANVTNYLATLSNNSFDNNANKDALTVYPNPTKDILNIETKNNSTISSASVYNTLGQIVMSTTTANTINVSSLTTGIYFIKVKLNNKESIIKFIKE
jgi:hypothetical protein